MSEKTNEELANRVELVLARQGRAWSEADSKDLQAAADRLRQQSEDSARLDWLNRVDACIDQIEGELQLEVVNHGYFYGGSIREAIDKARKS